MGIIAKPICSIQPIRLVSWQC